MTASCSYSISSACTAVTRPATVFDLTLVEERPGYVSVEIKGPRAAELFAREAGGHRWQRIPPTEKKGRVQSSSITVAVLVVPTEQEFRLDPRDLRETTCRSGGSGGQHVNKTESAVQILHIPSGVLVRCESERSQAQNRITALAILRTRLAEKQRVDTLAALNRDRKTQVGSGMRGDKVRTVAVQRDTVEDHDTGRRMTVKAYLRGHLEELYPKPAKPH